MVVSSPSKQQVLLLLLPSLPPTFSLGAEWCFGVKESKPACFEGEQNLQKEACNRFCIRTQLH